MAAKKKRGYLAQIITHICLVFIVIAVLIPIFLLILASLRKIGNLYVGIISFKKLTLINYHDLFFKTDFLLWTKNSLIVCSISTILAVIFASLAGYAFSRFHFTGKKYGLMTIILVQMFPAAMAMVAIYRLLYFFNFLTGGVIGHNLLGLILIYTGGGIGFNTWLIKGYLDSLPKELEESACIDGASHFQAFYKIILPLMGPILVAIAIFVFIGAYNDFLIPSIVLQDSSQYTLAVGLRSFISGRFSTNWTQFAAGACLGALPILIIFLSLQRFLVAGLTKGALKG